MSDLLLTRRTLLTAALGSSLLAGMGKAEAEVPDQENLWPVFGNPKGSTTIIEFFEYQCPNCKKLHPQLENFVSEHGSIRLVMRDWPIFGDVSVYASRMALAAGYIGKYERAFHALMKIPGRLTLKRVDETLRSAGIDTDQARDALEFNFDAIQGRLDQHAAQAKSLKLAGTPAFIVGNKLYPKVTNIDELRAAIES
ncbi:DsbA family protein [Phyllobacterium sp. YR531]|uniref:DsbA family protein n=1 Tax=Phyllobacterium sp. YR531 TaxID=1144343 RepID=UPI00026F7E68|nr:DsbA family protein [Phyllobacterium sp. YR531]EJN04629.1 protein-disulfide isomerase [Phyllobacterium sp. YR531]